MHIHTHTKPTWTYYKMYKNDKNTKYYFNINFKIKTENKYLN